MHSLCNVFKNEIFTFKIDLTIPIVPISPIIPVVKALDFQSRFPDSNLVSGFKIKVISVVNKW